MIKCETGGPHVWAVHARTEKYSWCLDRGLQTAFSMLSQLSRMSMLKKKKNSINQLTLTLSVWNCYVKNPKKKIQKLRDEPPRQGHILQEQAAHKQAFYHIL